VHGANRSSGNSLLDLVVFGRGWYSLGESAKRRRGGASQTDIDQSLAVCC
jgi:succinate dehydrogenase/fumarate reductase flavoprotein subunit